MTEDDEIVVIDLIKITTSQVTGSAAKIQLPPIVPCTHRKTVRLYKLIAPHALAFASHHGECGPSDDITRDTQGAPASHHLPHRLFVHARCFPLCHLRNIGEVIA